MGLSVLLSLWYGNLFHLRCYCSILWVPGTLRWRELPIDLQWARKETTIFKSLRIWVICYHSLLWWYLYFLFNLASLDVFNNTKSVQFFISHFSLHHTSCHPLLRTSAIIYAHVKGRWNHWWGKSAIMNWIWRRTSIVKTKGHNRKNFLRKEERI